MNATGSFTVDTQIVEFSSSKTLFLLDGINARLTLGENSLALKTASLLLEKSSMVTLKLPSFKISIHALHQPHCGFLIKWIFVLAAIAKLVSAAAIYMLEANY